MKKEGVPALEQEQGFAVLRPENISLKSHPKLDEAWLQTQIAADPTILGLGDLELLDRERRQAQGGRLDLLLADAKNEKRFEVEIQLGSTDESHVIRCLEYWDIERRRYPAFEHCAVLIAEDVTSRFLNIISLFAGSFPLVVIQLDVLKVEGGLILHFVKIVDQRQLREDEESVRADETTDRSYWVKKGSDASVKVAELCLEMINEKAVTKRNLTFKKHFIGLTDGLRAHNFVHFKARKSSVHVIVCTTENEHWMQACVNEGLDCDFDGRRIDVTISPSEFPKKQEFVRSLMHHAVAENE